VILLILVLFFQMFLAVRDAARSIPSPYFTTIEVLGGGALAKLRFVIIPAGLPRYITALRLGTGTSLAALFFSETFATRYGLGFFIMDSWMRVDYREMFAGIIAMGIVGACMFFMIDLAERLLTPWRRK
jgi:NitT/TauT family transport system permease protein